MICWNILSMKYNFKYYFFTLKNKEYFCNVILIVRLGIHQTGDVDCWPSYRLFGVSLDPAELCIKTKALLKYVF